MVRRPLDEHQLASIQEQYRPGVRGHGHRAIAHRLGLPEGTVKHAIQRLKTTGDTTTQVRGRKRALTPTDERRLRRRIDENPFATNAQLAADLGDKVTPRSVTNYLKGQNPPYVTKAPINQEPKEEGEEWKEDMRRFVRGPLKHTPLGTRVYEDETGIHDNKGCKRGRCRKGEKLYRTQPRFGKKYTLHVYARQDSVMHWDLSDKNARDPEILRVATAAARKIKHGETLIWDRLGRSGRCANPTKQHYNPTVLGRFKARGAKVLHLPPLGKYLQPLELLFHDLKEHRIRPARSREGQNLTRARLVQIIGTYMRTEAPTKLPGFFRERANGRQARRDGLI
eukprot:gnl/Trimastix_PCT/3415.p1 GENE.gnl/Trimastix_PCT/3415~~gnl/Trimastix_PCT/3415.p1  ORF type:complete len:339 (+),score=20.13 gnl/Trimastix_PCT/3415:1139-2155(+)